MNICAYCGAANDTTIGACWSCDKPLTAPVPRALAGAPRSAGGSPADLDPRRIAAALSGLDRRQKRTMASLLTLVLLGVALVLAAFVLRHQFLDKRRTIPAAEALQAFAAPMPVAGARYEPTSKDALTLLFGNFDAATQTALVQSAAPPDGWTNPWPGRQRVAVHQISQIGARGDERLVVMTLTAVDTAIGCSDCSASLGVSVMGRRQGHWVVDIPLTLIGSTRREAGLSDAGEVTVLSEGSWALLLSEHVGEDSARRSFLRVVVGERDGISLALDSQTAYKSTATQPCEGCAGDWLARPRFVAAAGDTVPQMMLEFSGVDAQGGAIGRTEQYRFSHGKYELTAEAGSPDPRQASEVAQQALAPPAAEQPAQSSDQPQ